MYILVRISVEVPEFIVSILVKKSVEVEVIEHRGRAGYLLPSRLRREDETISRLCLEGTYGRLPEWRVWALVDDGPPAEGLVDRGIMAVGNKMRMSPAATMSGEWIFMSGFQAFL